MVDRFIYDYALKYLFVKIPLELYNDKLQNIG